jgi:beta-lactamase regulating signal transducer with metallopeptidase domain
MPEASVANAWSWSVQIAVITVAGLLLPLAFRVTSPRARLVYLRALLVACVALPLLQPWLPVTSAEATFARPADVLNDHRLQDASTATDRTAPALAPAPSPSLMNGRRLGVALVTLYFGGVMLRVGWLAVGLWSLSRFRRSSMPLEPRPASVLEAVELVGVDAEFRVSPRVVQPVTFGFRHPVVLVPPLFLSFDPSQQKAIATHELLHVIRRDWLRTFGDRLVLSIFWFHPAIWWLVQQIDLSVEQLIDQRAVALVGERKPYLKALLQLATARPSPLLHPAMAFGNHSHLAQRVALLAREVSMSRVRLVASFAAVLVLLGAGAWYVVQAYPLKVAAVPLPPPAGVRSTAVSPTTVSSPVDLPPAPAGRQSRVPGTTVPAPATNEWPTLVTPGPVEYPPQALAEGRGGFVLFDLAIDQAGNVTDAKVRNSGSSWNLEQTPAGPAPEDLVAAARAAVLKAKFAPLSRPWPRLGLGLIFDPKLAKVEWLPVPPPPPPPPAGGGAAAAAPFDILQFAKLEEQMKSKLAGEPANIEVRCALGTLYWERAYRDGALSDVQKREYVALGLREIDLALQANPRSVDAMIFKSLLIRLQATVEPDPKKQQALVSEADRLRAEAIRLRNQK